MILFSVIISLISLWFAVFFRLSIKELRKILQCYRVKSI